MARLFLLLLSLLAGAPLGASASRGAPRAKTRNGTYVGRHLAELDQDLFLGMPFARAPRLDNPQPVDESWDGVRSAEWYGHACWTGFADPAYGGSLPRALAYVNVTVDEECLNLNVIRPAGQLGSLPVAVWFHGGGFTNGFGADSNTNTSYIVNASAARGVPFIAVTINYRLGFLGFPSGPQALAAGITNLGLKDQRAALRWVRENIAGFGGDPDRVTLWGQSAGASSAAHQLLAYGARGGQERLFRAAIMISGSPYLSNGLRATHPDNVALYEATLANTGCLDAQDQLACLRAAPVRSVWLAGSTAPYQTLWPCVDGSFVPEPPIHQLGAGRFDHGVAILIGANNDEGLLAANNMGTALQDDDDVAGLLAGLFPGARAETRARVLEAYPEDDDQPPYSLPRDAPLCEAMSRAGMTCGPQYRRVAAFVGDYLHASARRAMAEDWAAAGGTVYSYRFDTNPTAIPIANNSLRPGFSTHSSEYSYFFGYPRDYDTLNRNPPIANGSAHMDLSRGIGAALSSFIATGDPNRFKVPHFPRWPVYTVKKPVNMVWNATEADNKLNFHTEADTWRKEQLALWKQHPFELQFGS